MSSTKINTNQIYKLDFTYIQNTTSNLWSIVHNLGKYPRVSITDNTGDEVYGDIKHFDQNALTVVFSQPISGQAYLS